MEKEQDYYYTWCIVMILTAKVLKYELGKNRKWKKQQTKDPLAFLL